MRHGINNLGQVFAVTGRNQHFLPRLQGLSWPGGAKGFFGINQPKSIDGSILGYYR
jgi:hypothetical protein